MDHDPLLDDHAGTERVSTGALPPDTDVQAIVTAGYERCPGGYLVAGLLGVASDAKRATTRRAIFRLIAFVPYAIISGLAGAIVVGPVLGALTGHLLALWWLGALLVLAVGAVTLAFQTLFGVIGIGVTILVFVILGNLSAGGAYQPALLPPFWRAIGPALPNGAATDSVRRIVYFGAHDISGHLIVLAGYAVARGRRRRDRVHHQPASHDHWLTRPRTAAPRRPPP